MIISYGHSSLFYVYCKFEVIYNIFMWIQMFVHIKRINIQILDVGYESGFFLGLSEDKIISHQTTML